MKQHELVELLHFNFLRWKIYWLHAFFSLRYPKCKVFTFAEGLDKKKTK